MDVFFDWGLTYWKKTIWNKGSADIEKEFDSKLVYNKEFLRKRIKSHDDKSTHIYDKMSKVVILV